MVKDPGQDEIGGRVSLRFRSPPDLIPPPPSPGTLTRLTRLTPHPHPSDARHKERAYFDAHPHFGKEDKALLGVQRLEERLTEILVERIKVPLLLLAPARPACHAISQPTLSLSRPANNLRRPFSFSSRHTATHAAWRPR